MAVALIVAAGRGERLGSGRPKALVALAGRPMLEWSVDALRAVDAITRIVVALADRGARRGACGHGCRGRRCGSLGVGAQRASRGRRRRPGASSTTPLGRSRAPSCSTRALAELEATGADAVVAAAPVSDTIKQVGADGRTVVRTLERQQLWAVQTPQVFRRAVLERMLRQATDADLASATDEASLIERDGGVVRIVPSAPENLKVTTPGDLHVAELLLAGAPEPA